MSYENAPATRMLATHCACCGRPLVDAKSVEVGMGPDCRLKYNYDLAVSEGDRSEANRLIHHIAARQTGLDLGASIDRLREIGFTALAARVTIRVAPIRVVPWADSEGRQFLLVKAPYSVEAVEAWKAIRGRWWNGREKANAVPVSQKESLWALLKRHYGGLVGVGPKGFFLVPREV